MQTPFRSPIVAAACALLLLASVPTAQASLYVFESTLSGPNEQPPNSSPGTGTTRVIVDDVAKTMSVEATFSGLVANTTAAHIHAATAVPNAGTAGVATTVPNFPGFPLGVTSGTFSNTYDMTLNSSFNNAFITANGGNTTTAFSALLNAMLAERSYLNIHSSTYPAGEIRGFLRSVPDASSTALLLALGMGAMIGLSRRLVRR